MDGQNNIPPPPSGSIVLSSIPPPPSGSVVAAPPTSAPAAPPPVPLHSGLVGGLDQQPETPEGTYQMHDASGHVMAVPFSNVRKAAQSGMLFVNKQDLRQYARDYAAKPVDEGAVDRYLRTAPWWDLPSHVVNALAGAGTSALDLATHNDRPAHTIAEQQAQLAAANPNNNPGAGLGEIGEQVGEWFTGEELLGVLGRTAGALAKGAGAADKLKDAGTIANMLKKYPPLAKLLRVGVTAAKNGTITGAQVGAHTGDPNAAMRGAELGAIASPVLEMGGAALKTIGSKLAGTAPAAAAVGAPEYAAEARAAAKSHLAAVNDAITNAKPAPAGTATPETALVPRGNGIKPERTLPETSSIEVSNGRPVTATPTIESPNGAAPKQAFDVDAVLNRIHDFTGAADRLTEVNNAAYDALDKATGGKFRALNIEVQRAQKAAAFTRTPEARDLFEQKLGEMDQLLTNVAGFSGDALKTLKASWRQSYTLRDLGNVWDRSLNGVPGSTQASQAARGIDGKTLMNGLQRAVRTWGRANLEASLGQGRLENLENIARLNQTAAKRMVFNRNLHFITEYLPVHLGGGIGAHFGGLPGYIVGATMGAGAKIGGGIALDAVRSNPKIGQFFTYAIDSGANPKVWGPMIARMIEDQSKQGENENEHTEATDNQ